MRDDNLKKILKDIKENKINVDEAFNIIKDKGFEDIDFAKIDYDREKRNGFSEVVLCEGKQLDHVLGIIKNMNQKGVNILLTRVDSLLAEKIINIYKNAKHNKLARTIYIKNRDIKYTDNKVCIISGGTADIPVAEEAKSTLDAFGISNFTIYDIGVAGIHRLFSNLDRIKDSSVIITVAGMEGALPSVVTGLVSQPVIAVPTSIGYGANFKGLSALLTMLNSCSSGSSVVNIDNGFGAGYFASTIIKQIEKI